MADLLLFVSNDDLCKSKYHNKWPLSVSYKLDKFEPLNIVLKDMGSRIIQISNPFEDNKRVLISYLEENYDEIISTIKKFEKDVENIENSIKQFKDKLILIEQSKLNGLKGNCSIEKRGIGNKIKSFLHL